MKTQDKKLEDFIERCTAENGGHPPQMIGKNGFRMDLTVENYEKVKKNLREKIESSNLEKPKTNPTASGR